MSRSRLQRTLCVLVATFALALPLAAQPRTDERAALADRLIAALWERLAAPFASLRESVTAPTPSGTDSTDSSLPVDIPDGRAHLDPNG